MAKKILVVDDDKSTVTSLADLFETKGYKVIKAYNGEEGILKALKERPDILIADAILSKRSGMVKAIKLEKGFENILIILLGGIARKDNDQGLGENSLVSE